MLVYLSSFVRNNGLGSGFLLTFYSLIRSWKTEKKVTGTFCGPLKTTKLNKFNLQNYN